MEVMKRYSKMNNDGHSIITGVTVCASHIQILMKLPIFYISVFILVE